MQGRLGRTKNLPAYWDDIQDERHQEALFQTMFVATEGAEGGRLNTDATHEGAAGMADPAGGLLATPASWSS